MRHVALTNVFQFFNHSVPAGFYCSGGYNSLSPFFVGNFLPVGDSNLITNIYKVISEDKYILYMGYDYNDAVRAKRDYDKRNYRESKFYEVLSGNSSLLYSGPDMNQALYFKDSNDKEVRKLRLLDGKPYKYADIIEHLSNSGRVAEIVIEPFYLPDNQFILKSDRAGKNIIKSGMVVKNDADRDKLLLFVSQEFYHSDNYSVESDGIIILKDKYEINQTMFGIGVIVVLDKNQSIDFLNNRNKIIYYWDGNEIIKSLAE